MAEFFDGEILTVESVDLKVAFLIEAMELMRDLILHCYENGCGIPYELKEELRGFNSRISDYVLDEGAYEED
jgi:hypothetical protein